MAKPNRFGQAKEAFGDALIAAAGSADRVPMLLEREVRARPVLTLLAGLLVGYVVGQMRSLRR